MAAVPRQNRGWQRLYIFYISYILIRGLSPQTAFSDLNNISNSFYAGKIASTPQLSSTLLKVKAKNKTTEISASMKLAKLSRLVQYCSLASLLLLSGDICSNPGWTYPVLNSPGLKVAHLNIRSLSKHLDEFKILMVDNPFDVMCLSETWLNSTWSDTELHIDGYNIIRRDRDDSQRRGGTAKYYSTKFTARQRPDLFIQDIETVWLELTLPNRKKALICALYKPPNADFDAFKASLDNILEQSASEGVETLILGDFNCDMLPNRLPKKLQRAHATTKHIPIRSTY